MEFASNADRLAKWHGYAKTKTDSNDFVCHICCNLIGMRLCQCLHIPIHFVSESEEKRTLRKCCFDLLWQVRVLLLLMFFLC